MLSPEKTRWTERNRTGRSVVGQRPAAEGVGHRRHGDLGRVDDGHAPALRHEALTEDAGHLAGLALGHELPVAQHDPPVADGADGVGRVRHQEDGAPLLLELG